ncbi:unnamed protein product [Orchesella dallaii]|uniref:C2H2-type domain-containing protein n=1 Tax=Orchesella dallaii TaxID=48710 RepID=A0ABP1RUZ9_9HEXA
MSDDADSSNQMTSITVKVEVKVENVFYNEDNDEEYHHFEQDESSSMCVSDETEVLFKQDQGKRSLASDERSRRAARRASNAEAQRRFQQAQSNNPKPQRKMITLILTGEEVAAKNERELSSEAAKRKRKAEAQRRFRLRQKMAKTQNINRQRKEVTMTGEEVAAKKARHAERQRRYQLRKKLAKTDNNNGQRKDVTMTGEEVTAKETELSSEAAKRKRKAEAQRRFRLRQKMAKMQNINRQRKEVTMTGEEVTVKKETEPSSEELRKREARRARKAEAQRRFRLRQKMAKTQSNNRQRKEVAMTREEVTAKKAKNAERQRRFRLRMKLANMQSNNYQGKKVTVTGGEDEVAAKRETELSSEELRMWEARRARRAEAQRRFRLRKKLAQNNNGQQKKFIMTGEEVAVAVKKEGDLSSVESGFQLQNKLEPSQSNNPNPQLKKVTSTEEDVAAEKETDFSLELQREMRRARNAEAQRRFKLRKKLAQTQSNNPQREKKNPQTRRQQKPEMTAEEIETKKRERYQKKAMWRIERMARMTDQQLKDLREGRRLDYLQRKAKQDENLLKKKRVKERKRNAKLCEEEMIKRRAYGKKVRENLSEAQYIRQLQKVNEFYHRKCKRLREFEPEKYEEMNRRSRERQKAKRAKNRELKAAGKPIIKRNYRHFKEKPGPRFNFIEYMRKRRANETPEERKTRLDQGKLNAAKRKLRKKLTAEGASAEEIEKEVKGLEATFQPSNKYFKSTPRRKNSKPVNKNEGDHDNAKLEASCLIKLCPVSNSHPSSSVSSIAPPLQGLQEPILPATITNVPVAVFHPDSQPVNVQECLLEDTEVASRNTSIDGNCHSDIGWENDDKNNEEDGDGEVNVDEEITSEFEDLQNSTPTPPASPSPPPSSAEEESNESHQHQHENVPLSIVTSHPPLPPPTKIGEESSSTLKRKGPGRPRLHSIKPKRPRRPFKANPEDMRICEICGQSCVHYYIHVHMRYSHHPHFSPASKTCDSCSAGPFKHCRDFYDNHWVPVHEVKPDEEKEEQSKPYICDECGTTFKGLRGLEHHRVAKHGDMKKHPCPICKREYGSKFSLSSHLFRIHKNEGRYPCLRCETKVASQEELKSHVEKEHPSSFFPCEACGLLKFSLQAKLFHFVKCLKMPTFQKQNPDQAKLLNEGYKAKAYNKIRINCEICEGIVTMNSLNRHYLEIHEVVNNEQFKCEYCGKTFKRREFWVGHLEMVHEVDLEEDEVKEKIRKYYVKDRSKVVVKNRDGGNKGKRPNRPYIKKDKKNKVDKVVKNNMEIDSNYEDSPEEEEEQMVEKQINRRSARRRKPVNYRENPVDIEKDKKLVVPLVRLSDKEFNIYFKLSKKEVTNEFDGDNAIEREDETNEIRSS